MEMLNIGCGRKYHTEWTNIDLISLSPCVIGHDLTKGLPFDGNSFDVCYSSHVLEHLRKEEASFFIKEQKRVLKRDGIIRVVVPDLEVICRNYLKYLDELVSGDLTHEFRYDYSLLELYDQTTRDKSGGELLEVWQSGNIPDLEYVMSRSGSEAVNAINSFRERRSRNGHTNPMNSNQTINSIFTKQGVTKIFSLGKHFAAEWKQALLLGRRNVQFLREGIFRNSGEIHRIMYDRYSLKRLLLSHGFNEIKVVQAHESSIPNFSYYQLDIIDNGMARKPGSLFIEARA
jgi:SAM-dependent methyltransferase